MKIIMHTADIYEIEDFLTDDELSILLSPDNSNEFIDLWPGTTVKDLLPNSEGTVSNISNRLMSYFEDAHSHTQITNIRRIKEGESMKAHTDGGYPNSKQTIVFGVVIYLNDDFIGGELNYPDLNISIKPKKNSLMIHNAKILHGVLPVTRGDRYCLTSFIFGDEATRIKL